MMINAILESRGNAIRKKRYNYIAVDFDGTLCAHEFPALYPPATAANRRPGRKPSDSRKPPVPESP